MLLSQRALFDIPREICYLNAASWSPLPIATQDAGRAGVARKGQPWLIDPAHPAAQYERARRAAARLINADADEVALISSVSYGVAAAAKLVTVPARSRVLVLENDHSSAVLEWTTRVSSGRFTVDVVPRPGDGDWTAAVLAAIERGPALPPSALPRSRPCTGPTAGWWIWTALPRRCAGKGRCCWSMPPTPPA
jgi:selenocysteine lyase/cysteine desulfurase